MAEKRIISSEAHLRAQRKYDMAHKGNYRNFFLKCNKVSDADIIEYLENKENYAGFLKSLIRECIADGR